jgi:hypothetical protein
MTNAKPKISCKSVFKNEKKEGIVKDFTDRWAEIIKRLEQNSHNP